MAPSSRTKPVVAVIFGGRSNEHDVSLRSAAAVLESIDDTRYAVVPVGITRSGDWYRYRGPVEAVADGRWEELEQNLTPVAVSPNRSTHGLLELGENSLSVVPLDCAFPVLHGRFGEDGTVQGLLELGGIPVVGCGTLASALGMDKARVPLDCAFPVLHGRFGEDGTVQGLLELGGIPVVGCGTLASALGMDKARAHRIAAAAGVAVPRSLPFERWERAGAAQAVARAGFGYPLFVKPVRSGSSHGISMVTDPSGFDDAFERWERAGAAQAVARAGFGYPLFVKPVRSGSSHGISMVTDPSGFDDALDRAFSMDDTVTVEERVEGFEVGCAVVGTGERLTTGLVDEVELAGEGFLDHAEKYERATATIHMPARLDGRTADRITQAALTVYRALGCLAGEGFLDHAEKYERATATIHMPARLDGRTADRITQAALTVYRALGCSGFARVDLFLTPDGQIVFNEVNTIPGLTAMSRFPAMMRGAGMDLPQLVDLLISNTLEEARHEGSGQ